jgi:hypothetical protein
MVLQGSGQEIYILENHKLRPFSSPDTYDYFRKRYHLKVHVVDDDVLAPFATGQPIRRWVKCNALPDVYSLENGQKRPANVSLPFDSPSRWDQVRPVVCKFLHGLPDGEPIFD